MAINFSRVAPHNFLVTSELKVSLYSSTSKETIKSFSKFNDIVYSGMFRNDGKLVVAGDEKGSIKVFDINSKGILRTFKGHEGPVRVTHFSEDKVHVFSASDDHTVRYWNLPENQNIFVAKEHTDIVRCGTTILSNPQLFVTGGYDHLIKVWDARTEGSVMTLSGSAPLESIAALPSGQLLFAAGVDSKIHVFDLQAGGKPAKEMSNHQKTVTSLSLSPDSSQLISGSLDRQVKVYDITNDFSVIYSWGFPAPVFCSAIAPDNSVLVTGMSDGTLAISSPALYNTKAPLSLVNSASSSSPSSAAAFSTESIISPFENLAKSKRNTSQRVATNYNISSDTLVVRNKRKRDLQAYDVLLRKYEYSAALSNALRYSKYPVVVYTLLEELVHRGALRTALVNRDDAALLPLITFIRINFTNYRYSRLLLQVLDEITNLYPNAAHASRTMYNEFKLLQKAMRHEQQKQANMLTLVGTLEFFVGTQPH